MNGVGRCGTFLATHQYWQHLEGNTGQPDSDIAKSPLRPKTHKAAEYHSRVFAAKVEGKLEEMAKLPVSVFVCGPSEPQDLLCKKKIDIVNALRENSHDAMLGEEEVEELKQRDRASGRPVRLDNVYENEIASAADVVVILRGSPGSVAEFHEFFQNPNIEAKMYVFADGAHDAGYSSAGALNMHELLQGKVVRYKSPDDITNCTIKTRVQEIVSNFQAAKWIRQQHIA